MKTINKYDKIELYKDALKAGLNTLLYENNNFVPDIDYIREIDEISKLLAPYVDKKYYNDSITVQDVINQAMIIKEAASEWFLNEGEMICESEGISNEADLLQYGKEHMIFVLLENVFNIDFSSMHNFERDFIYERIESLCKKSATYLIERQRKKG